MIATATAVQYQRAYASTPWALGSGHVSRRPCTMQVLTGLAVYYLGGLSSPK